MFGSIDIGLAVAQKDGLITPVVRDCGSKGVVQIDEELTVLIDKALTGKLKQEESMPDGQKRTVWRDVSLDPKVVITRANGEKVAEGVMPFG